LSASRAALWAWALYDLANTTFSLNVVSRYLPLIVVQDLGGRDLDVSIAYSASMLLVAASSPVLGALSDLSGRRLPYLAITTAGAVAATAVMGFGLSMTTLLLLFAASNYCYQAALVFYDALLANVSDETTRGRASGLGIGLGYGGAILSLYSVAPIAERFGKAAAFPATAALFLVFAIPCFVFVKEGRGNARRPRIRHAFARVRATLARLPRHPALARFLLAHFLYTDAVNTVILFMAVYVTVAGGFTSAEVTRLLALSTVFAIVGAFAQGPVIDRIGAKRALHLALALWALGLAVALLAVKTALWLVGPITGSALGATWAADRVLMFRLSPPESLGELYGLYGMVGRFSAITGPLIWGAVVYLLQGSGTIAYQAAIASLLVMLLAGMAVLATVSEPRRAMTRDVMREEGIPPGPA
jgi:UMF1 family MFS transporter